MIKQDSYTCDCGREALFWLNDVMPQCMWCAVDRVLALLNCGTRVTLHIEGKPDWTIEPENIYRSKN